MFSNVNTDNFRFFQATEYQKMVQQTLWRLLLGRRPKGLDHKSNWLVYRTKVAYSESSTWKSAWRDNDTR